MTEKDVIKAWKHICDMHNPSTFIFPNIFIGDYEADILEISKLGYVHEYEIKLTVPDFKKDILKNYRGIRKHDLIVSGKHVNTFSYIVPENMISIADIPEYAGLIYINMRDNKIYSFKTIKRARRVSKEKIGDKIKEKCLLSTYYRFHKLFK